MKSKAILFAFLVLSVVLCLFFVSCGSGDDTNSSSKGESKQISVSYEDSSDNESSFEERKSEESSEEQKNSMKIMFGSDTYMINGINIEISNGITVYDEEAQIPRSPDRKSNFIDVIVMENAVVKIGEINERLCFPYPNGILVCFTGNDAVEFAKTVSLGESVNCFGFEYSVSPTYYCFISDKYKIEISYMNEKRTEVAYAVLYDGEYMYDSTTTNIWGYEIAVDRNGKIVEKVKEFTEGISGDTDIPEGGFVISTGLSKYMSYLKKTEIGDSAVLVKKDSPYFFRAIAECQKNKIPDGKYLAVFTAGDTPVNERAIEYILDSEGYVTDIHTGGGIIVPDGCKIVYAYDYKRVELERFYSDGTKFIIPERAGNIYLFKESETVYNQKKENFEIIKKNIETAKKNLLPVDFAVIDELVQKAEDELSSLEKSYSVKETLDEISCLLIPSYPIQERAAWVVDYDSNDADCRHTVEYAYSLGMKTIIVSPFRDNYTMYPTKVEHMYSHPDLKSGEDVVASYIRYAHEKGMKVYFMLCTFVSDCPSDNYSEEHYVNYFADKLLISRTGRDAAYYYSDASYTLNPYDTEVREFFLDIITEVCDNYQIDGFMLDYDRFPLPSSFDKSTYEDHGYNADIIEAFNEKYGVSPKKLTVDGNLWKEWCDFRSDIITSFIGEAKEIVSKYAIPLCCTVFASEDDRQKYVFQDVKKWVDCGFADEIYPMIYGENYEIQKHYADELKGILENSCVIVWGTGTYTGQTVDDLTKQICDFSLFGGDGTSAFALQYIKPFSLDTVYKNVYRCESYPVNSFGKAVKAFANYFRNVITNTYSYLKPKYDFSGIIKKTAEIEALFGDYSGETDLENAEFYDSLTNNLTELVTLIWSNGYDSDTANSLANSVMPYIESIQRYK